MKSKKTAALDLVKLACQVLEDKKAGSLCVLNVSAQSSITDYLILATATSEPHLRALRVELEKALDSAEVHLVGMEAPQESGWIVIDAFDVMIHLFSAEMRDRYGLERLWQDAVEVPVKTILQSVSAKPIRKAVRKAAPVKPKAKKKRVSGK